MRARALHTHPGGRKRAVAARRDRALVTRMSTANRLIACGMHPEHTVLAEDRPPAPRATAGNWSPANVPCDNDVVVSVHPRRPRARRVKLRALSLDGDRDDRPEPASQGPTTPSARPAPNQADPAARLHSTSQSRQLASSDVKVAFPAPPSSLPTKSQFFRLCGGPHSRKNYLFVGDVDSGKSLAGLYSLVATCESRGITRSTT
jgi:hypothetical protein